MDKKKSNLKTLSVKISEELFDKLTDKQYELRTSKSDLVRRILEDYIKKHDAEP